MSAYLYEERLLKEAVARLQRSNEAVFEVIKATANLLSACGPEEFDGVLRDILDPEPDFKVSQETGIRYWRTPEGEWRPRVLTDEHGRVVGLEHVAGWFPSREHELSKNCWCQPEIIKVAEEARVRAEQDVATSEEDRETNLIRAERAEQERDELARLAYEANEGEKRLEARVTVLEAALTKIAARNTACTCVEDARAALAGSEPPEPTP